MTEAKTSSLEKLRGVTTPALAYGQLAHFPVFLLAGLAVGSAGVWVATILSALVAGAGVAAMKMNGSTASTRHMLATGYVLQASLLTFLFSGHAWQIDMHMYFFASLAMGAALFDWRSVLVAAGITALHHLVLNFTVPAWVFPGGSDVARVVLHAVIVICETGVLVWLSREFGRALESADAASEKAHQLAEESKEMAEKANVMAQEAEDAKRSMADAEGKAREAEQKARAEAEKAKEAEQKASQAASEALDAEKKARESEQHAIAEAEKAQSAEQTVVASQKTIEERANRQTELVKVLEANLRKLSEGDLTVQITEPFEENYESLRKDFNKAVTTMRDAIGTISENSISIEHGVGEISQAADDLSKRTKNQASSLENTASALNQATSTVNETAEAAQHTNNIVSRTKERAENSGDIVREAVSAMSEIEKSSGEVNQIISVIDEIAFQTNLLALNAGVEAARAGDAGRGFAVVASEVRALAQRSSDAAKEIKQLISQSTQHVESGVELVGKTGKALERIVEQVAEVSTLVSDIASSAQEQSRGLAEINEAVNQMDQVTQQNAAMVAESTSASHALKQKANEQIRMVSHFSIGNQKAVSKTSTPAPKPVEQKPQVIEQQQRAASFAASHGSAAVQAAVQHSSGDEDNWDEF